MLLAQFLFNVCSPSSTFSSRIKGEAMEEEAPNQTEETEPRGSPEVIAAQKVQKMYRSYRTRRRLADSVVVAEELWWQALDYARQNHSTVSFFDHEHPETVASRWSRVTINAIKVGHGLCEDDHARTLAFQHWIEAIDPRHRYGQNLQLYYNEWCNSSSDEPFFYWLDVGEGHSVDLKECPRSKLKKQCVKYLGPHEREHYEYIIKDGRIMHKQLEVFLDTRKDSKEEKWIFVMSSEKKIYAGVKKKGSFHHSSFLAGGATIAAGKLTVQDGYFKCISPHSGHYKPKDENINNFLDFLQENGVDLEEIEVPRRSSNDDYEEEPKQEQETESLEPAATPHETTTKEDTTIQGVADNKDAANPRIDRTLSGMQISRAIVPREAILERINSKKEMNSYQLGHQLARTWSSGAGPRIGCVADYPAELRAHALELVSLTPSNLIQA
ncbi:IQ calmodulin-binding motif family protein [Rhynchospora pubera]|uniref:IQ calmodulin-binding motif family protein n=1 Tax=Rhynchospora pubera TaxID=906938 RepID=A0AAV8CH37_9POAL|nr:IQ calmodulin-binding motif family protein [Rhynchospora pubera]